MYEPFEAQCSNGLTTVTANVYGDKVMVIPMNNGIVFITKEQAMKFFGLVNPNEDDNDIHRHQAYFSHR